MHNFKHGHEARETQASKRWGSSVTRHPPVLPVLTSSAVEPVSEYTSRGRTWDFHPAGSGEGADFRVRFPYLRQPCVWSPCSISVLCACVCVCVCIRHASSIPNSKILVRKAADLRCGRRRRISDPPSLGLTDGGRRTAPRRGLEGDTGDTWSSRGACMVCDDVLDDGI